MAYEDESVLGPILEEFRMAEVGLIMGKECVNEIDWNTTDRDKRRKMNKVAKLYRDQLKNMRNLPKKLTEEVNRLVQDYAEIINQVKPTKKRVINKEKKAKKQRVEEPEEEGNPLMDNQVEVQEEQAPAELEIVQEEPEKEAEKPEEIPVPPPVPEPTPEPTPEPVSEPIPEVPTPAPGQWQP